MEEAVTEAFDRFTNAVDFSDINAGADDHVDIVNWEFVISNLDFAHRSAWADSVEGCHWPQPVDSRSE